MSEDRAISVLKSVDGLEMTMKQWVPVWDKLARRIMPRRVVEMSSKNEASIPNQSDWSSFSPRACNALQKLAAGHLAFITPINQIWYKYASDIAEKERVDEWYSRCSEKSIKRLARSNFYTEIHECFMDRCLFGTGCLYFGGDDANGINFKYIPCGKFAIAENASGRVDALARRFMYSAKQAADEFQEENLGEKVKEALADPMKMYEPCWEFVHLVRPRAKWMPGSDNPMEWRFESVYVSVDDKKIVDDGGYQEFPYIVTRFLKWGTGAYGLPPGLFAFPNICDELFLRELLNRLGEIAVNPRVLLAADQVGEVNFRAGGQTIVSKDAVMEGLPREWMTGGRYDIGKDRLASEEEAIGRAFFEDAFTNISNVDREMTAAEVFARESEKILPFSPSFSLVVSDLEPFHERYFNILFRSGEFEEFGSVPKEAVVPIMGGTSNKIAAPKVSYCGKMALAIESLQSDAIPNCLQLLSMVAQFDQSAVDLIKSREVLRTFFRAKGFPEDGMRGVDELKKIDERNEQAAADQQELMMAQAAASAAKDGTQAAATAQQAGITL